MASNIISLKSISEKSIANDLINYIKSQPDNKKWLDFLESSAGTTIVELIAGLGYFKAYHESMMNRESKIDTALMKSSLLELAFNRGFLLAPTNTGHISITFVPSSNFIIVKGTSIGLISDYDLYAIESKTCVKNIESTIECAVGHKNTFTEVVNGFGPFSMHEYNTQDEYIASELESLTVNGDSVGLLSDLNYLTDYGNDFCLRRCRENEVRIYSGNGNIGFMNPDNSELVYECISYGSDLQTKMSGSVNLAIDSTMISYSIVSYPDYSMSKDKIRGLATFYPMDGRLVQDKDYEIAINKYFGSVVKDVYAINNDPDEELYMIVEDYITDRDKDEIKNMIDNRRAMGIHVFYNYYPMSSGIEYTVNFSIKSTNIYATIESDIKNFFKKLLYTFPRSDITYHSKDLASQLSSYFGFPVYDNSDTSVSLSSYDFFKEITINITAIDEDLIMN